MKKIIVLFSLMFCLLPFGVYGADICEYKCNSSYTWQSDNDFCTTQVKDGKLSDTSYCDLGANFNLVCAGSKKVCCCSPGTSNIVSETTKSSAVSPLNFTPEISIPGSDFNSQTPIPVGQAEDTKSNGATTVTMKSDLLAKYIQAIYNYGLAIVSILAAIVLMGGGLLWLTSGGDSGRVTKAKEMIIGSISGLVILFCAWIILNTVNPELLKLKTIDTVVISKINMTCCQQNNLAEMTNEKECSDKKGQSFLGYFVNSSRTSCELPGCCIYKWSNGKIHDCYNGMKSNCSDSDTFVNTSCDKAIVGLVNTGLNNSSGITADITSYCPDLCASRKDGENCYEKDKMVTDSFCYSGICWRGKGKEGEPCGNEGGICGGNSSWGLSSCKESRDLLGGRDCFGALLCCIGKQ